MKYLYLPVFSLIIITTLISGNIFQQEGKASFYADKFVGRLTANGEIYSQEKMTAAHLSLPFNTMVKVTNKKNGKSVIVRVNDRGPFVEGRIIDLTEMAARKLDFINDGVAEVSIEAINETDSEIANMVDEKLKDVVVEEDKPPFFEINASKIEPAGFGVQVGCYKDLENLFDSVGEIKAEHDIKLTAQPYMVNNVKVYRLIAGAFGERNAAELLKKRLSNKYPDCFIYTFDDGDN